MNEKHLFSVYDSAAKLFLDPFVASTHEVAIREFRRIVNQAGHQFNRFPEDYTLYHLGSFDAESGLLHGSDPRSLGIAQSFMNHDQLQLLEAEVENG